MKRLLFLAAICLLCNSSCTMDGADNGGNSAESPATTTQEAGTTDPNAYTPNAIDPAAVSTDTSATDTANRSNHTP